MRKNDEAILGIWLPKDGTVTVVGAGYQQFIVKNILQYRRDGKTQ